MIESPLAFLFGLERFGMKFGLDNMARLCESLDHPEQSFTPIIIGGTNGKGSVTAMAGRALMAAGHRTAWYTSPHLMRLEERYVIDGVEVDSAVLERAAARVQDAVERLLSSGVFEAPPTFFECATAIAFDLFREHHVHIAVLEVGLGGRLDATNIVTPVAAAIVSIDFDHQAQLGDTLTSIAYEKAGIIKPGIPVVCGTLPDEAVDVIERVCRERGARLIRADREVHDTVSLDAGRTRVHARTAKHDYGELTLALPGRHQASNAAVAIRLLETLDDQGIAVDPRAIETGLTSASWPGRLERRHYREREILLDAAHNPAGARALAAYLAEAMPPPTLVFGAMKDKAVAEMLAALAPAVGRVIGTTAPGPRAMDATAIAELARDAGLHAEVEPDPVAALDRALSHDDPIVVAGSIFLIGPLRDILR